VQHPAHTINVPQADFDGISQSPDIDPGIVNQNLRRIVSDIPGIDVIDPTDTIIAENRKTHCISGLIPT
jgi:hypothetical protein